MTAKKQMDRKEVSRMPMKRGRFSAGAALLVAGLALGNGCRNDVDVPQKPKTEQKATAQSGCEMKPLGGSVNLVSVKEGRCIVREGDEFARVEFLFEKAGFFSFKVGRIDEDSVELPLSSDLYGKAASTVVFGETVTFWMGEWSRQVSLTVSAEKGPEPKTAVLTIAYSEPDAGKTEDGKIRVPFLFEKDGYFEFDAPRKSGALKGKAADKDCKVKTPKGVNIVRFKEGRCEVKKGDELLTIEFLFEKAGYFAYSVGKIDDNGVDIVMDMEIFMSEHTSNRGMPWRVDFGETKAIGRSVAPDGTVVGEDILTIKAEKGATPGTAILTISKAQ